MTSPNSKPRTLAQYRSLIRKEAPFVDIKPYSHNIISMALLAMSMAYGRDEANKAIDDFNLEELGWKKEKTTK